MYMYAPGQVYIETIDGQNVPIADIPNLRFVVSKMATDSKGALASFELGEPVYEPASELSDDVPLVGQRLSRSLPAYPSDVIEATGAWLLTTSDLALDLWVQRSKANMTHLCHQSVPVGAAKLVKPLFRIELGMALRYKIKADREVWTRPQDPKTKVFGSWKKDRVVEGAFQQRMQGVRWGDRYTLQGLVETTPCLPLPEGEARDSWFVERHEIVRTFPLPYFPMAAAVNPPTAPKNAPASDKN
jgi:hypothetical protein